MSAFSDATTKDEITAEFAITGQVDSEDPVLTFEQGPPTVLAQVKHGENTADGADLTDKKGGRSGRMLGHEAVGENTHTVCPGNS
mgnify:CR=1 FL=1